VTRPEVCTTWSSENQMLQLQKFRELFNKFKKIVTIQNRATLIYLNTITSE
jgi:hypothetical protein